MLFQQSPLDVLIHETAAVNDLPSVVLDLSEFLAVDLVPSVEGRRDILLEFDVHVTHQVIVVMEP